MSDLLRVVAYVFRRQGRDRLGRNEFKQLLSFGLNWYPPAQAAQLLDRALQAGLLVAEGDQVRLGFAAETVELPLNFRGGPAALDEPLPGVPAARPPQEAAAKPPDTALLERAHALRATAQGRLDPEVALLLARSERGTDVRREAAERLAAKGVPAG